MEGKVEPQPTFFCAYPEVTKACARLGIYTIPELYSRVEAAVNAAIADGLRIDSAFFSRRNLKQILVGRDKAGTFVNPWNTGRKCFRPLAVAVGFALGRSPRFLFGASSDLEALNEKIYEIPSPQRDHIKRLMSQAKNPLTGRQGLTMETVRELAVEPALKGRALTTVLAGKKTNKSSKSFPAFYKEAGNASSLALDLATILDRPVEEVFPHSAAQRGGLPLDRYEPLRAHTQLPASEEANPERACQLLEVKRLLKKAMEQLTDRQRTALLEGVDDKPLEDIAREMGVSSERVRQIQVRALLLLKGLLRRQFGITSNPLSPHAQPTRNYVDRRQLGRGRCEEALKV